MMEAWRLRDGTAVIIRSIEPDDEPSMVNFHRTLSDRSVYFRYFHLTRLDQRIRHDRLAKICTIDPSHEVALVAVRAPVPSSPADLPEIIGVGRLTRLARPDAAEIALLVADAHQGKGLGSELLRRLIEAARQGGIHDVMGDILAENEAMMAVARRAGFVLKADPADPKVVRADLKLE